MNIDPVKLEAMVDSLLGGYLSAIFDFRMLAPMLYDKDVIERYGSGVRASGFISIRYGLYYHVLQECWKLGCDADKRSYSVARIMSALSDPCVIDFLRKRYSACTVPIDEGVDADTRQLLERVDQVEALRRGTEFDRLWIELMDRWNDFEKAQFVLGVVEARKKVAAHTEIRAIDGKFRALDLSDIGIKWGDERLFLNQLRRIVELLNFVVRRASFAWEEFDAQTSRDAAAYWEMAEQGARANAGTCHESC